MAYTAFPQINSLFDKDKEQAAATGGGDIVGGGASQAPANSQGGQLSKVQNPDAFIKANQGEGATDISKGFTDSIEKTKGDIQKSEQDYKAGLKGPDAIADEKIDKGIAGSQEDLKAVSDRLAAGSAGYQDKAYSYRPGEINNLNLLTQGQKGTEALLRTTKGPGYSAGMAAQDARLFNQNPAYRQQIQNVLQQKAGLDKTYADTKDLANKDYEAAKKAYEEATTGLKSGLQNRASGIEQNIAERQKSNQAVLNAEYEAQKAAALRQAQGELDRGRSLGGEVGNYYSNLDLNQFLGGPRQLTQGDVANADEVTKFQNLSNLLGLGKQIDTSKSSEAGPAFKQDAFKAALGKYDLGALLAAQAASSPSSMNPGYENPQSTAAGLGQAKGAAQGTANQIGNSIYSAATNPVPQPVAMQGQAAIGAAKSVGKKLKKLF